MDQVYRDQSLFVAVNIQGAASLLGASGAKVSEEVDRRGCDLRSLRFDEDYHPPRPGLHVWDGSLRVSTAEDGSEAWSWDGEWRPATLADFQRFGLLAPKEQEE